MTAKRFLIEVSTAPGDIIGNLFRYRHILARMVVTEIKGRFAGSVGGLFWHFLHPILMLIIYLFVFVHVFKMRIGGGGAVASSIYLMAGLFPWIIMAEGLTRGTSSIIENSGLIQKTSFPTEILTAKAVLAPLLSYGIALLLLMLYVSVVHASAGALLLVPLILIVQTFFSAGVVFLTSTLSVYFRDTLQLVQVMVNFWLYITPILYPVDMLPEWARRVMYLNPVYPLVSAYQSIFVNGSMVNWPMLLLSAAWASVFFVSGAFVFNKLKYEFADWL
jgi:lipopolysaccharide transport system permease protein